MFSKDTSYKYVVEHIKSLEPPLPERLDIIKFLICYQGKHYYYLSSTTNPKYGGYHGTVEVQQNGSVTAVEDFHFELYIWRLAGQRYKK